PVVEAALRVPITHARSATGLVRDVMLEITSNRWPAAAPPGARGVPDLGQVPQHPPGIMARGLPPVIALPGGQRPDLDQQVPLPGNSGGEPPGPVAAWWAGRIDSGEGKPGPAGRIRSAGFVPFSAAGGGCGPGAAVPDRAPALAGPGP